MRGDEGFNLQGKRCGTFPWKRKSDSLFKFSQTEEEDGYVYAQLVTNDASCQKLAIYYLPDPEIKRIEMVHFSLYSSDPLSIWGEKLPVVVINSKDYPPAMYVSDPEIFEGERPAYHVGYIIKARSASEDVSYSWVVLTSSNNLDLECDLPPEMQKIYRVFNCPSKK